MRLVFAGDERLTRRLLLVPADQIFLSGITVGEALNGWFIELERYRTSKPSQPLEKIYTELFQTVHDLNSFNLLPYTEVCEAKFKAIYTRKAQVKSEDWRLASHALVANAVVVTRNVRDFERIAAHADAPLLYEDWSE